MKWFFGRYTASYSIKVGVVGKAVIKELRRRYPESNIVAVDYDPGASEVNQLNRIKLMIAAAKKAHKAKFADGDEPQGFTAAD